MIDSMRYVYLTQDLSSEKRKGWLNLHSLIIPLSPSQVVAVIQNLAHMWLMYSLAIMEKQ